jgi:hypothetical protein
MDALWARQPQKTSVSLHWGRISFFVAQVSKPAVPQTSKSASRQQVWKPALQAAALVLFAQLPKSEMRPCIDLKSLFVLLVRATLDR